MAAASLQATPFFVTERDLSGGNKLYIVDIIDINNELKALLDAKFVRICEGNSGTTMQIVKDRV
ncbi:MAG: hypothetical protein J7578_24130, partial [Chitinophagaceae bacterium]|nr:hypothetical protein [Chitinophagaceae bacterium]